MFSRRRPRIGRKEKKGYQALRWGYFQEDVKFVKYLSYWKDLEICHAINGMYIQKNVFDSTFGILLDVKGKIKE
jgi:hypothetical protein